MTHLCLVSHFSSITNYDGRKCLESFINFSVLIVCSLPPSWHFVIQHRYYFSCTRLSNRFPFHFQFYLFHLGGLLLFLNPCFPRTPSRNVRVTCLTRFSSFPYHIRVCHCLVRLIPPPTNNPSSSFM